MAMKSSRSNEKNGNFFVRSGMDKLLDDAVIIIQNNCNSENEQVREFFLFLMGYYYHQKEQYNDYKARQRAAIKGSSNISVPSEEHTTSISEKTSTPYPQTTYRAGLEALPRTERKSESLVLSIDAVDSHEPSSSPLSTLAVADEPLTTAAHNTHIKTEPPTSAMIMHTQIAATVTATAKQVDSSRKIDIVGPRTRFAILPNEHQPPMPFVTGSAATTVQQHVKQSSPIKTPKGPSAASSVTPKRLRKALLQTPTGFDDEQDMDTSITHFASDSASVGYCCAFCHATHDSIDCPVYSTHKQIDERTKELHLCFHCLLPRKGHPYPCEHRKQCTYCHQHFSHVAFCRKRIQNRTRLESDSPMKKNKAGNVGDQAVNL